MRFLSIYTPDRKAGGSPPSQEEMDQMEALIEESMRSGLLLETGAILPLSTGGAVVRRTGNEITVVDGPFAESKEVIAGYAVLEANSIEEAVEGVKRFLRVPGDGETEIRQIMEGSVTCAPKTGSP